MWKAKGFKEIQEAIQEVEDHMEENYIRYCDYTNPLHGPTLYMMRVALCHLRLRILLLRLKSQPASDPIRYEVSLLASRALNYDVACHND